MSLLSCLSYQAARAESITPEAQVRQLARGINILDEDPLWTRRAAARFTRRHFKLIRDAGFSAVRVNLAAFAHLDAANRLAPAWLATLDWVIAEASAAGLSVVLDEHDFLDCAKSFENCRTKLVAVWEQIAARYAAAPPEVVFELLNEPNGAVNATNWNALLTELLAVVRRTNDARNVIIGPAEWNSLRGLPDLKLPESDKHIILSVHYYDPMSFTHQGAPWSPSTFHLRGVTWGSEADVQMLKRDFDTVQAWADAHGRPVYLGEFGAFDAAELASRVRYTSSVARAAESRGWAWAYWRFDINFAAFDVGRDAWNVPILKALQP